MYVVASDVGLTKIGTAESALRYISMLCSTSPVPLRLAYSLKLQHQLAKEVKARCNGELAKFHSHGGWFKVSTETAWDCVQRHYRGAMEAAEAQQRREELLITALSEKKISP